MIVHKSAAVVQVGGDFHFVMSDASVDRLGENHRDGPHDEHAHAHDPLRHGASRDGGAHCRGQRPRLNAEDPTGA